MEKRLVTLCLLLAVIGVNPGHTASVATQTDELRDRWHIHVTLHVFSGRPDPTWRISDLHPSYKLLVRNMGAIPSKQLPSRLGYKGFTIIHVAPGHNLFSGGAINQTVTSFPDWEMLLLDTAEGVGSNVKQHVKEVILQVKKSTNRKRRSMSDALRYESPSSYYDPYNEYGYVRTTRNPLMPNMDEESLRKLAVYLSLNKTIKPVSMGSTKFHPERWNMPYVVDTNNCYNYANDEMTFTMAQPGRAHDCPIDARHPTGLGVKKSATCDGLKALTAPNSRTLPQHTLNMVALVLWPPQSLGDDWDYHWYRLDGNQYWSHKPGRTVATVLDDSGHRIKDPRHADRGPYTEFVSFMETRPDKVNVL